MDNLTKSDIIIIILFLIPISMGIYRVYKGIIEILKDKQ